MANLRRNGTITHTSGSYVAPGASYKVNAYPAGAIANGPIVTNTIPVFDGHGFSAGQYAMAGLDTTKVARVASVVTTPGSSSITLDAGHGFASVANDVLINLGVDTAPRPSFVQSGTAAVIIYSTPDTTTPITSPAPSVVICDANGEYGYYYPSDATIWELIRDSSGTPVGYYVTNTSTTLGTSGTPFVDNAIARWDGTTGLLLQSAYTSNTPTISDAGGITAAGTHSLGRSGATTAFAGSVTVAEALTVASGQVLTAPGANSLGATGNTNTVNGALTVTENFSANGTTNAIAGTNFNVTAAASTLGKTTTGQLNVSAGTAPSSSITLSSGWGSTPAGSAVISSGGKDNRFTVDVTAGGSGFTANPTVTITFGTAFAVAPQGVVVMNRLSGATANSCSWTTSTTGMVITMYGTPAAGHFYFSVILMG